MTFERHLNVQLVWCAYLCEYVELAFAKQLLWQWGMFCGWDGKYTRWEVNSGQYSLAWGFGFTAFWRVERQFCSEVRRVVVQAWQFEAQYSDCMAVAHCCVSVDGEVWQAFAYCWVVSACRRATVPPLFGMPEQCWRAIRSGAHCVIGQQSQLLGSLGGLKTSLRGPRWDGPSASNAVMRAADAVLTTILTAGGHACLWAVYTVT